MASSPCGSGAQGEKRNEVDIKTLPRHNTDDAATPSDLRETLEPVEERRTSRVSYR